LRWPTLTAKGALHLDTCRGCIDHNDVCCDIATNSKHPSKFNFFWDKDRRHLDIGNIIHCNSVDALDTPYSGDDIMSKPRVFHEPIKVHTRQRDDESGREYSSSTAGEESDPDMNMSHLNPSDIEHPSLDNVITEDDEDAVFTLSRSATLDVDDNIDSSDWTDDGCETHESDWTDDGCETHESDADDEGDADDESDADDEGDTDHESDGGDESDNRYGSGSHVTLVNFQMRVENAKVEFYDKNGYRPCSEEEHETVVKGVLEKLNIARVPVSWEERWG
jgi:hypothetical protein